MKSIILDMIRRIVGTKMLLSLSYENRRFQLVDHILHDSEMGITADRYVDHEIVVSLTTYGKRIHDVAFTIESIMQQSMKANRIVLWLDNSFKEKQLPQALKKQQDRGLEIEFCNDIRSYTKLIPSLKMYPDDAIITIDDDLIYDYDLLEHLILSYKVDLNNIHCCRCREILFKKNGSIKNYNRWPLVENIEDINKPLFFTGVGGVLYPPKSLDVNVFDEPTFMDICKFGDDIWFNAMARKNGTSIRKVYTRNPEGEDYILNPFVQDVGLFHINTKGEKLNDIQIKAVFSKYNIKFE